MTAETAAVNDRRNMVPEFPMYECPQESGLIEHFQTWPTSWWATSISIKLELAFCPELPLSHNRTRHLTLDKTWPHRPLCNTHNPPRSPRPMCGSDWRLDRRRLREWMRGLGRCRAPSGIMRRLWGNMRRWLGRGRKRLRRGRMRLSRGTEKYERWKRRAWN